MFRISKNYDGMRINNFVVIKRDYKEKGKWVFLCKCDCGKEFHVGHSSLMRRKSCGCLTWEMNHAHAIKHGGRNERLYKVWDGIKYRCGNPHAPGYERYGGRGIKVCPEWQTDYAAFRKWSLENGYDENAPTGECTLDRIDVNGDYEPSNCRWANMTVQSNNRRSNVRLTYNGETKTIAEWARVSGVDRKTIEHRVRNGWSAEGAIFTKPSKGNKRR